tara:strand:+ start:6630 stop:7139 length:510 start_codon:yes stop_codon:yes gene_type:complete
MSNLPILNIAIINNPELYELYKNKVEAHNNMVKVSSTPDSGFDLFIPNDETFNNYKHASGIWKPLFVDLNVKACMIKNNKCVGFQIYPRSSISKTPLMLANQVGIIDSGYRGSLMAAFRSFQEEYKIEKHSRLVQICHPSLKPFLVKIVNEDDLSITERGEGGFGSTGI